MNKISIDAANKQFHGEIKVGQYVAFWISEDKQNSLPMTWGSHETEEQALEEAKTEGEKEGLKGGTYEAEIVNEMSENKQNIDLTGHEAEVSFLKEQEAEILKSNEYLESLRSELAEQKQRIADGFEKEQEGDLFGGFFQQTEKQWVEARQDRINQLERAIARHPLANGK